MSLPALFSPQYILSQLSDEVQAAVTPTYRAYLDEDVLEANSIIQFASLADWRAWPPMSAGRIVMLDIEPWSRTPTSEQDHAHATFRTFATEAHAMGYLAIAAPALSLPRRLNCGSFDSTREKRYLRCRFASLGEDALLVQSQSLARDPRAFARFLRQVKAQAPASCKVYGELSTRGPDWTAAQLQAAYNAANQYVDGWGLWTGNVSDYTPLNDFAEAII